MNNKLNLIFLIIIMTIFWPENESPIGFLLFLITLSLVFIFFNKQFCLLLTATFSTTYLNSYYLFNVTDKLGLFRTSTQDQYLGMTDSQFFLYLAEQVIKNQSYDMLFWTWGSLVPTLYGAIILYIFNLYYVIIFFNCLLYISSILIILKLFQINSLKLLDIFIISIMPLPILYNGMLSKEPIFLYLVCLGISYIGRISKFDLRLNGLNIKLSLVTIVLLIFRPIGAVILLGLYSFKAKSSSLIKTIFFLFTFVTVVIYLLLSLGYPLPLFFLNNGSFDITPMIEMQKKLALIKEIPIFLHEFIIPPYSLLLFPLLLFVWFFGPLANVETFYNSITGIITYGYSFSDIVNIVKFLDLFITLFLLFILIKYRNLLNIKNINLLILPLFIILYFIVSFNFLESSRHKYFTTVFLFILYKISMFSGEKIIKGNVTN
jgi:hypothetical protein